MSANPSFGSDELGISKGTILGDHHMVEAFLGEGSFGVVTRCRDTKNNKTVAVKVNKSDPEILLQAKLEIFILEQLRRLDPDRCNIVEWNGYFLDGERICLNFELLDQSLSDYIGDRNNRGLPMREIRPILHQLANALFHLGSVGIVHADLKPVNIMVVNHDYDVLKFIIETQGQLPDHLLESGLYTDSYFIEDNHKEQRWTFKTPEQFQYETHYRSKETRSIKLKCLDDLEQLLKVRRGPENGQTLFVRLIKEMLALDANQRITPSEVLKHPFFHPGLSRRTPSDPEILLQAKLEIFILEQLRRLDPDRCNIVEWNDYFLDGQRICLNFELLDQSLWDYIGDRNNRGLPMRELRPILHQLANALFHLGSVGIVHADLKPGNIMVLNHSESPVKVKLIDFGLACPASAVIPGDRVGTIGYCAPEVMLGIPYHEAIDMWSLGLVAVELATGVPLYPGEDDYDVLKFIIETQGQLPDHLLESEQFQYETHYRSKETRYIKLKCLDDLEKLLKVRRGPENGQTLFVRLIKEMLALDANLRITPSEVLKHPFFHPALK
uniref:Protein kinase domain-containing protein n=1 Tax=Maylandia zebra TaxID=106582 RepID=A0A3P9DHE1_9CICH